MAEHQLLGLFDGPGAVADALEQLRKLGVREEQVEVLSGAPYRPEMLGRPKPRGGVGRVAGIGAILGVLTAGFLTAGIWLLYPLFQGGQPLIPIPPSLIVFFEVTMLGTMWAAFFGLMVIGRFPRLKPEAYDPRITEGKIGMLAQVDESLVDVATRLLRELGAVDVVHIPSAAVPGHRAWGRFVLGFVAVVILASVVTMIFTYDLVRIPFPTNMSDQDSIAYEEGPRLAAPAAAVPVQGPVLIAGQPASEPVPADPASLQRGAVLFGLNCDICHGQTGDGKGNLSGFFTPGPANLTSPPIQALSDDDIFLVIANGFGLMPSMADNLPPVDRWDVINHVRTLAR